MCFFPFQPCCGPPHFSVSARATPLSCSDAVAPAMNLRGRICPNRAKPTVFDFGQCADIIIGRGNVQKDDGSAMLSGRRSPPAKSAVRQKEWEGIMTESPPVVDREAPARTDARSADPFVREITVRDVNEAWARGLRDF